HPAERSRMMATSTIFTSRIDGSTLILEVHGTVSSLVDDAALAEVDKVLDILRSGTVQHVIVDFGQSPYFGSTMLETLRRIWNDVQAKQGRMVLCNVSPVGKEILQIAKFDHLWAVLPTRQDAERELKAKR